MGAFRSHNLDAAMGILKGESETSLKRAGLVLKKRMQELAPLWTGRMERSVSLGNVTFKDDAFHLLVGPTVDYAITTEEEPWIIGKRPGPKSQVKGATIPWMKPAAQDVGDQVREIMVDGIRATVKGLQARYKGGF